MTKRLNSKHKVDRRLKVNLWGRPKSPFNSRAYPPGQHGQNKSTKPSDYGIQLQAKQKLKSYYGNINERQFRNIYKKAIMKKGDSAENLIGFLERRLDNVVFKLNFSHSRKQARQIVGHGHFTVNDMPTNIPSFQVKVGDVIKWKSSKKDKVFVKTISEELSSRDIPDWLELNQEELEGKVIDLPEINEDELDLETRLIVEHYSR